MASILAFRQPQKDQNWTNEELAELFRVVDILGRAGVAIDTDMGLSDEGEPWFAFCRADTGDVIVHFSRIDGQFVAVSAATDAVMRGNNFRRVAEALVNRQPLILPAPSSGQKLFLHPAVILTALVATTLAQMKSWEGQEIVAFDDVADGAARTVSEASFAETLKTAFVDALNLVLRGFTGPMESKYASGDNAHTTGLGLGLGNLSLASVVAFAISVIQGSSSQDDADIASRVALTAENADGATKAAATSAIGAPQITENKTQADAGAPDRVADIRETVATKAAARDAAVSGAMEKSARADKSGATVSDDEGFVRVAQKEQADKPVAAENVAVNGQEKLLLADVKPEAPRAEATRNAAPPAAEHKEVVTAHVTEFNARTEHHSFTFTEISKEAIEIFFVKVTDDSSRSDNVVTFSVSPTSQLTNGSIEISGLNSARSALNASDIVFAGGDPVALARLNLITDFVNSTDNKFSTPASFPELLSQYWSGDKALTVVVFDSDDLPLNIFAFTNNVLFIEESEFAGIASDFGDGSLQVDLANGGDVTLLGVFNLNPTIAA